MKRLKKRKRIKLFYILTIIVLITLILCIFILKTYEKMVSPKVMHVAKTEVREFTENFLSNNIGYSILNNKNLENILIINKNKEGEILYVDYNLDKAYEALDIITTTLYSLLDDLEYGKFNNIRDKNIISSSNGLALRVPLFIFSDNMLFSSFGPSIYIKVGFISTTLTNIKSQITDYGLNNALVELYVTIKIREELITPVNKEEILIDYDVLIASKVINGRVPYFYGGSISSQSNILDIPIA